MRPSNCIERWLDAPDSEEPWQLHLTLRFQLRADQYMYSVSVKSGNVQMRQVMSSRASVWRTSGAVECFRWSSTSTMHNPKRCGASVR